METSASRIPEFLAFWGKAQPDANAPATYPRTHPIAYHSLDVAACADALLSARPRLLERGGTLLGLSAPNDVRQVLVTLAALHDLGKFAPAFQCKAPEHWPAALGALVPESIPRSRHTEDGYVLWRGPLARRVTERLWPNGGGALRVLAPAVFGHHGSPVGDANQTPAAQRFRGGLSASLACGDTLLALLSPAPISAAAPEPDLARIASWWFAGLMTVADWVGSGQRWFRYAAPLADDPTLSAYWERARETAGDAIRAAGLCPPPVAGGQSYDALLSRAWTPSPAQAWTERCPLPAGPSLFLMEDVTGAGKTEAAHMLVHRLLCAGGGGGTYWALPTQATANAMYERQAKVFDRLYVAGAEPRPSLVLAHGQQRLHEGFRATVLDDVAAGAGMHDDVGEDGPGTATCAAFLADDRRAALLADVGAGTVDQAILGVLNSRFNAVRLFGLADHILVIDEAHAYDAYMAVEVEELLRFQAALGGSAIVLSATLSRRQRERIASAWIDGLRAAGRPVPANDSVQIRSSEYPLATVVSCEGVREEYVAAAEWSKRRVDVRLVHEVNAARDHIVHAARVGGAAVWIRNTVDDCLEGARLLREAGLEHEPIVFHARFAQADRQQREREVMARFGKDAEAGARAGRVLVATQVVEQSLDLDFDAMVSDVAPIDLLVQRAGRLQRHASRDRTRPPGCKPELVVLSPVPNEDPTVDWLGGVFKGTAHVYRHAGVLWRTVRELADVGAIVTPEGLRGLIEAVFGSDEVPDALLRDAQRAEGQQLSDAATATYATLKVSAGYDASQSAWLSDLRVPTRLGDEQTTVRLARVQGGRLVPWAEADAAWKAWALSEVRVRQTRVPRGAAPLPEYAAAAEEARASWGRFEQELPVLPLTEQAPGVWCGELLRPDRGESFTVRYAVAEGLAFGATVDAGRSQGTSVRRSPQVRGRRIQPGTSADE